jgi:hypothetical protein
MNVTAPVRLGLRQNAAQFTLLVIVNALVGGVLGSERTVLPLLGQTGIPPVRVLRGAELYPRFRPDLAAANVLAGTLSDRYGRKPVLLAGWLMAIAMSQLAVDGDVGQVVP